jgi:hypothetical protein
LSAPRRRHGIAAAQDAADARQQFARLERFRQVVVGAHFQAEDAVQRLVAGGQHDDRQRRVGAQLAAQGQAVVAGQVEVEHHQLGAGFVQQLPHGSAVGGAQRGSRSIRGNRPAGCGYRDRRQRSK